MALQYFSSNPKVEFISQKLIRVVAAFNTSDLAILIESQPLDLDLDMQDYIFSNFNRTSTLVEVALEFQRLIPIVC